MVKILHFSDLHLDNPFTGIGLDRSRILQRRADLLEIFKRLMLVAKEREVDLILIAGDLFEETYVRPETIKRTLAAIAGAAPLPVIISPGNHDPYHPASPYATEELPGNLHVFKKMEIEKLDFDDLGVLVYGHGFQKPHHSEELLRGFTADSPERVQILLVHGAVYEGEKGLAERYHPVDMKDLKSTGADYVALGHYHHEIEVWRDKDGNSLRAVYPGSPEPLRSGPSQQRGALLIEIDSESKAVSFERIPTQKLHYKEIEIDLTDAATIREIDSLIGAAMSKPDLAGNIVRIVLAGTIPPDCHLDPVDYRNLSTDYFSFEFENRTRPAYDLEVIAAGKSTRSAFCRLVLEKMEAAESEDTKDVLEQALWLGLAAFEGQDIQELAL